MVSLVLDNKDVKMLITALANAHEWFINVAYL
jgi:hypothetical protein